jgi:hypothetical protein
MLYGQIIKNPAFIRIQLIIVRGRGMLERIKSWWRGKYQAPTLEDIFDSSAHGQGAYVRPWPARILNLLFEFCKAEWKWIIGTALVIVGLVIAYLKLGEQ